MSDAEQGEAPVPYGQGATTFHAAGGEPGIRRLVDAFYDNMASNPAYARIHAWHPDEEVARDKLARFLCGWMGGPRRYQEKYGSISIPQVHGHLPITEIERDQWLQCMASALGEQPYPESLRRYLIEKLAYPAEHVRRRCAATLPTQR